MAVSRYVLDPNDIDQIFDGDQWRNTIIVPEPSEVGIVSFSDYPQILIPMLIVELEGQGNTSWVNAWPIEDLPPIRFDPTNVRQ